MYLFQIITEWWAQSQESLKLWKLNQLERAWTRTVVLEHTSPNITQAWEPARKRNTECTQCEKPAKNMIKKINLLTHCTKLSSFGFFWKLSFKNVDKFSNKLFYWQSNKFMYCVLWISLCLIDSLFALIYLVIKYIRWNYIFDAL